MHEYANELFSFDNFLLLSPLNIYKVLFKLVHVSASTNYVSIANLLHINIMLQWPNLNCTCIMITGFCAGTHLLIFICLKQLLLLFMKTQLHFVWFVFRIALVTRVPKDAYYGISLTKVADFKNTILSRWLKI